MKNNLYIEIDLRVIKANIESIMETSNRKLIPVIKSNAYALGDTEVMQLVHEMNLDYAAVVDDFEAIKLLKINPNYHILILNSFTTYEIINDYPYLALSINNVKDALKLNSTNLKRIVKVHMQVDTGMNRLGFKNKDEFIQALNLLKANPYIEIEGLYTHFTGTKNYQNELAIFNQYINYYPFTMVHAAASSTYPLTNIGTHVRVGLDIYGTGAIGGTNQAIKVGCYPIAINEVKRGETVGYDKTFVARNDTKIAVLPIGYANGFRRSLKHYFVAAKDRIFPVVGNVCMNHIFVEIDDDIDINTEFIITSPEHPISKMAEYLNTISHEILCMLNIENKIYIK